MEHIIAKLLNEFEQGKISRRQIIQRMALVATAASAVAPVVASDNKVVKAVAINHVSYQVHDYARTRDFYADLFGMQVSQDTGKECVLTFGNSMLIPRNLGLRPSSGPGVHGSFTPGIDHIAYTIAKWDTDKNVRPAVEAELKRRGLEVRPTEVGFHIYDPDGFDIQMGGKDQ